MATKDKPIKLTVANMKALKTDQGLSEFKVIFSNKTAWSDKISLDDLAKLCDKKGGAVMVTITPIQTTVKKKKQADLLEDERAKQKK